jgi:hypothetical protein
MIFEHELRLPRGTTERTRKIRATESSAHGGKYDPQPNTTKGTTHETRIDRARITGEMYDKKNPHPL